MKVYWYCCSCARAVPEEEMVFTDTEDSLCPHCLRNNAYPVRMVRADYKRSLSLALLEISLWFSVGVLATLGVIYLISL